MKYDLIIFDVDNTLYDFRKTELRAFNNTMQIYGINDNLDELHSIYKKINQQIWIDNERGEITAEALRSARFERLFEKTGIDLQPDKIIKKYLSYLAEGTDLLDGAKNLINHLFGKTRMVLATNGIADVQIPRISQSELSKYFDGLFISEELGFPKPDVRFFKEMFSRISDFEKAVIVGDNLSSDIQGGINADIDTCWFNPLKDENDFGILPTYEIENLMDLIDLVK